MHLEASVVLRRGNFAYNKVTYMYVHMYLLYRVYDQYITQNHNPDTYSTMS